MKVFVVLAVTLAVCGISVADEDKKTKILAFWKCLSCHADPVSRDEFMKCAELKPEKCKKIAEECKHKIIPEAITPEARWDVVCKNEHNEAEQLYECVVEHKKDLTDDEKDKFKEFISCVKKVDKKFCEH